MQQERESETDIALPKHAHRSVRFRPAGGAHRAAAGRAARRGAAAGGAAGVPRELEDRSVRDLPELLRAGDALVVNDTKVIPARLRPRASAAANRAERSRRPCTKRLDGSRWRAFVQPAKKPRGRRRRPLRRRGQGLLPRPARRHGRSQGRGRRGHAGLRVSRRRCSTRPSPSAATCRCRPISRRRARRRRAGPHRLPDHVRARRRLGRGADGGPAFHRRADGAALARARRRRCTR